MKRNVLGLLVVGAVWLGIAYASQYDIIRPNSTSSPTYYSWTQTFDGSGDSTTIDTVEVDTFFSDTITLGDYAYMLYNLQLTGYSLCDSCNDSVVFVVEGYGMKEGAMVTKIVTDTIPTTLGTLDSTEIVSGTIKIDSLGFDRLYFRTIVKDSIITDDTAATTNTYRLTYRTLQAKVQQR